MNASGNLSPDEHQRVGSFLAARRIPRALERCIEEYITKKTGKPWDDPVILERLRRSITAQKNDYWNAPKKRRLAYAKGYSVLGYLAYHFPVYFMQAEYLMQTLATAGLLRQEMRVLDVGTGPGIIPLAVADFASRLDNLSAEIWSIEQAEEHREAFRFLRDAFSQSMRNVIIHPPLQADIRTMADEKIPGPVDLLVFSNVINELEDLTVEQQADLVLRFAGHVAPDGTILITEPAEEITATRLRVLSLALRDCGLAIHSPCSFIWGTRCEPSRCWSFERQPDIRPTHLMEALAACREPYRYINTDIKYAYVILRRDSAVQHPYRTPPGAKVARFSKLHQHINRRINVIAAKMSDDLGSPKTRVFKLCDGTAAKPVYAILPAYHRNPANDTIVSAPYGAIIELQNVLVRFNRNHDAYNLLVSRNTRVTKG